ncbi:Na(+)-translocating NADH-quinone reductase subunit A [Rapidithrix thailandica]|uniref:Na(+)-translocating NADH-quinone reductase subunit A n=1 Tax=Rapidithrix thailandica TaxID=413964 RepID=A0AAW9RVT6_9BACT
MSKSIKLSKGFDIKLAGKAEKKIANIEQPETFALKPTDFVGIYMPKVVVQVGDTVKAGSPLFYDKKMEKVQYCAPVSGEVVEVKRGKKRKLLEIKVLADKQVEYEEFPKYSVSDLANVSREDFTGVMLKSGVWPNIIQRPYGVIANPEDTPQAIFISAFDTNPLAPDYDFIFKGQEKYFQAGVDVLRKFTSGSIHVNVNGKEELSQIFAHAKDVVVNKFSGPHPAGNVGVQIHHLQPLNAEDLVWTLTPYGVIQIGKLFLEGIYDATKVIAFAGSEVKNPQYYQTYSGACVNKYVESNTKSTEGIRVVSGNVLTGEKIKKDGYLGFYDHLVTVLPEGDVPRFVLSDGWLAPTFKRLSFHRAFGLFSFLNSGSKEYVLDTNMNGEERPFVMSGAFEKVVPMDLYPTYLLKAILAEDFDEMEALGIYEVIEEDLALCEFIDVSKHDIQSLLREGLDMMRLG